MAKKQVDTKLIDSAPRDELAVLIREATQAVEDELKLEDAGWLSLSGTSSDVITAADRITNLQLSRLYAAKDPLGAQSIRLWTDYTFGTGITWSVDEENKQTKAVMDAFWDSRVNQSVLSSSGQRKCSKKLLIDGEIFFAIFLGKESSIRTIDPLEITEIITDPDDIDNEMFYRRTWTNSQAQSLSKVYRSYSNIKNVSAKDSLGKDVKQSEGADAVIYHLTYNTTTQRGNPLLLPALDWIKYYRRFLASRIAVALALARFAWRTKVTGGQAAVNAIKAKTHEKEVNAGSTIVENMGSDTQQIRMDSGASAAYQDGKMIKYQVCSAVGIPEQYFGDISTGNLATAKTVELPMFKMFQSYQSVWRDAYKTINEIVLEWNKVPPDKWYVDLDFPAIAPEDVLAAATALVQVVSVMPDLAYSDDVKQIALMIIGVNDPAEVLEQISQESKKNPTLALTKALKLVKEAVKEQS